jgi:adenosine deaminase
VRIIEDPSLLDHLKRQRIHLEVCPSCNVQTNVFNTLTDHPIDRLHRSGVSVGVNTDARTITHVTLAEEYERLHRTFGWDKKDFATCNLNAIDASFASDKVKSRTSERLIEGYRDA